MGMDIVMFAGKQGSGKTTSAEALAIEAVRIGYDLVYFEKFATKLYQLHNLILNFMEETTGQPRVKKDGDLLQYLGTDYGRKKFGDAVWVTGIKKEIKKHLAFAPQSKILIIIDDCRFANEFEAFPEALRVRLHASEEIRKARAESWRPDVNHPSEIGLDRYDQFNLFDLYVKTEDPKLGPAHVANLVCHELQTRNWVAKRG